MLRQVPRALCKLPAALSRHPLPQLGQKPATLQALLHCLYGPLTGSPHAQQPQGLCKGDTAEDRPTHSQPSQPTLPCPCGCCSSCLLRLCMCLSSCAGWYCSPASAPVDLRSVCLSFNSSPDASILCLSTPHMPTQAPPVSHRMNGPKATLKGLRSSPAQLGVLAACYSLLQVQVWGAAC